jgi:exopolysaccharide biosynthesis protein
MVHFMRLCFVKLNVALLFLGIAASVFAIDISIEESALLKNNLGQFHQITVNIEYQNVNAYIATLSEPYQATLYFQPNDASLVPISLKKIHDTHPFTIAINGGFYKADYTPAGLYLSEGVLKQKAVPHSLLNACVGVNQDKHMVFGKTQFDCMDAVSAIQTGPILLEEGNVTETINNPPRNSEFFQVHRRTVIGKTKAGALLLMVTDPVTLAQLVQILQSTPSYLNGDPLLHAINLDGGVFTGMFAELESEPFNFQEMKPVNNVFYFESAPKQ